MAFPKPEKQKLLHNKFNDFSHYSHHSHYSHYSLTLPKLPNTPYNNKREQFDTALFY